MLGPGAMDTFDIFDIVAIFQIIGVNVEIIKKRKVKKVWVMFISVKEKIVCYYILDMRSKILELYDSHCSFSGLKKRYCLSVHLTR